MRSLAFAVVMLAACVQPGPREPEAPAPTPPAADVSAEVRADLVRLDRALAAEGIIAAGLGETADLGGGLTLRPMAVKSDSRCPQDVTCVWAGELVLEANIAGVVRELKLGEPLETPQGVVVLEVAKPGRWAHWPDGVSQPAYGFGFRRR